ncbi:c-type cytochrome [Pendulispora albinea]|uniref:Cytochrome c domain-containing protein n=1 Tax=Pendulispora albinea TaxID=2741071 RepID=A0ABZ2MBS4_9BACT
MKSRWQRILAGIGVGVLALVAAAGAWVLFQVRAYDASVERVYDVPVPQQVVRSTDPAVLERGDHLARSLGSCANSECHGSNLAGGHPLQLGPLGTVIGPNITPGPGSAAAAYSDGELVRLIQHGIKRDGRSVQFMPCHEFGWMPGPEVMAIVSYVRSVPPVDQTSGKSSLGTLAKVLDRTGQVTVDVARKIDHTRPTDAPITPEPTAAYGAYLARGCGTCHGQGLSGGRIPGAPASMATPANLTPDSTGLEKWTFDDFSKVLDTGIRPDGRKLSPDMPYENLSKTNLLERRALWAYLRSLPPRPFGNR